MAGKFNGSFARTLNAFQFLGAAVACAALVLIVFVSSAPAQIAGRNVNMVSGTKWPDGDPYLQRQNEPSVAASTRNPLHLLAGANDYRTVDIPFVAGADVTGDAWLGMFKSYDGGQRWISTLLPGYPQDQSIAGLASPLKGYAAAADPVVRPGTHGLLYYSGMVFDRVPPNASATFQGRSAIFVARFIDNNNQEDGDTISYVSTSIVAKSTGGTNGDFFDKPWLAVDIPRGNAATCRIVTPDLFAKPLPNGTTPSITQTIPAGNAYVAYTRVWYDAALLMHAEIRFSSSTDCGKTWSPSVVLSRPEDRLNQGASIAIDPNSGRVFVTWRRISGSDTDAGNAMMAVQAPNVGGKPGTAREVRRLPRHGKHVPNPEEYFEHRGKNREDDAEQERKREREKEQGTGEHGDGQANGKDKDNNAKPNPKPPGQSATKTPIAAENMVGEFDQSTADILNGLSFRTNAYPSLAIDGSGRLYLAWTERGFATGLANAGVNGDPHVGDARIVISTSTDGVTWSDPKAVANEGDPGHQLMPTLTFGGGKLVLVYYDLREDVSGTFTEFVDDQTAIANSEKRHTLDMRASFGTPGAAPAFPPSIRVSDYLVGYQGDVLQQLQFNAPNLPMFKMGTAPFMGDYVDVAFAPAFVPTSNGRWAYNTNGAQPVFHAVWTDNRDVREPTVDPDATPSTYNPWAHYTAPTMRAAGSASTFDPLGEVLPTCSPENTGARNQNIYTARLSTGLVAGSPGNTKPLSTSLQRAFVVFAQNTSQFTKAFRLNIVNQPVGGHASFRQFDGRLGALTTIDVTTPPWSTASRSVYVTSSDPAAQIKVTATEITAAGGTVSAGGLSDVIILNPDTTNPAITNPAITNPAITNPAITNPAITNPAITNPAITNPAITNAILQNPAITNTEIYNPAITNPAITNPAITNPAITNPAITNPAITNPAITNPAITNSDLLNPAITNPDMMNPAITNNTVVNPAITNPAITNPAITNPAITNPAITNPAITNPAITNPAITNGSLTDVTWTMVNTGNTTAAFNVGSFLVSSTAAAKLCSSTVTTNCISAQLLLQKTYTTPTATACLLEVETHDILVANILNPTFVTVPAAPNQNDPAATNGTIWLAPGETAVITLRLINFLSTPDNVAVGGATIDKEFAPPSSGGTGILPTPQPAPQGVSSDLPPGTTTPVVVAPIGSTTMMFVTEPSNALAGSPIAPTVRVRILNAAGVGVAGIPVTLSLFGASSGAGLSGNTAQTNASGIASFPALSASTPRVGYQLQATAGPSAGWLAPAFSFPFTVRYLLVALPLARATNEDTPLTISDVLANQPNPNGGVLSITGVSSASHGTTGSTSATISYTPASHYSGPDSFTYTVSDGFVTSAPATVAISVNATGPPTFVVTNTNDSGPGSLRQAILNANTHPGADTITFSIPGTGPFTIAPALQLPALSERVIIDGYTQPGAASGAPIIELAGNGSGPGDGLSLLPPANGSTVRGLVINRFARGIVVEGDGNTIAGNFVGTNVAGTAALGNIGDGISVVGGSNNTIGGTTLADRNVISGSAYGIAVGGGGVNNLIQGNYIGTDVTGTIAIPNGAVGVTLGAGAATNTIGGTIPGTGNLIAGNLHGGIGLYGAGTGNLVQGNLIGVNVTGAVALANGGFGIYANNTPGLTVGGTVPQARNVISGNMGPGVGLNGAGTTNAIVQGNHVGTDATGLIPLGNLSTGISISGASNNVVGGTSPGSGNLVSGNAGTGILITGATSTGNTVAGNLVGTNAAGTSALPNGNAGVQIVGASNNTIGGPTPEARNLISGAPSGRNNVSLRSGATNNVVRGNYIGTNLTGTAVVGGGGTGVIIGESSNNTITNNVISGVNHGVLFVVQGAPSLATGNVITANKIGTDPSGNVVFGNTAAGVWIQDGASNNMIGGPAEVNGNIIRGNVLGGVMIQTGTGNAVLSNSISSNPGLGIDLGTNGVTLNDAPGALDADVGANNLQNFPLLTQVLTSPTTTNIQGVLKSAANTSFTLQFFSNATCSPSGYGQGDQLVGTAVVTTDPGGSANFALDFAVSTAAGQVITATATDPLGNTSEFSACRVVTQPPVDTPPLGNVDSYVVLGAQTLTVTAPGVLANDTDPDGEALTAVLVTPPAQGVLTFNPDGSFSYVAPDVAIGAGGLNLSFAYKAVDPRGGQSSQTWVSIHVIEPLRIQSQSSPNAVLNQGANVGFSASGGRNGVAWSIVGTKPPGLDIHPAFGYFTGQATNTGSYSFTVQVSDCVEPGGCPTDWPAQTATMPYTLRISALDQSAYEDGTSIAFGATGYTKIAQVVRVGTTGSMTGAIFPFLSCADGTTLSVAVRRLSGLPPFLVDDATDPLASGTVTGAPWSSVWFATPTFLPVNSKVAVVLSATGGTCQVRANGSNDPYPSGQPYVYSSDSWLSPADFKELSFSTYVLPEGLSYTTGQLVTPTLTELIDGRLLVVSGTSGFVYDPAARTFTATANSMSVSRQVHAAVRLPSGKVLVAGGEGSSGGSTTTWDTADVYDPGTNSFSLVTGHMTAARSAFTMTLLANGTVLIAGGQDPGHGMFGLQSAEIYDPATGTFAVTTGTMLLGRNTHTATLLPNGTVLIVGGYGGSWGGPGTMPTAEIYDPSNGSFRATTGGTAAGVERYMHTATALANGNVVVAGGAGSYSALNDAIELYDVTSDSFSTIGHLTVLRRQHSATLLADGRVLFAGGLDAMNVNYETMSSVEIFNPATGTSTPAGQLTVLRAAHQAVRLACPAGNPACSYKDDVFFVGGSSYNASDLTPYSAEVRDVHATPGAMTLTSAPSPLPNGQSGAMYPAAALVASGGTGGYTFAIAAGSLPLGLELTPSTGAISSTPTTPGAYSFMASATDGTGAKTYQNFTIRVDALTITTPSLAGGVVNQPYTAALAASGTSPFSWAIDSAIGGPAGLAVASSGTITWTPTGTGCWMLGVRVSDVSYQTATRNYQICAFLPLQITTTALSDGAAGWSGGSCLSSQGGNWPTAWSVDGGALPPGMTLGSNGCLLGSTLTTGTFNFTAKVIDGSGQTATKPLTLGVYASDQYFASNDSAAALSIGGGQRLAQVVHVGMTGDLRDLNLPVSCASGDLTVEIRDVTGGGYPGPTSLYSWTVQGSTLPPFIGTPYLRLLPLPVPQFFAVDARFAFVLSSLNGTCSIQQMPAAADWRYTYLDGDGARNTGGGWSPMADASRPDLAFQTVVDPRGALVFASGSSVGHTATLLASGPDAGKILLVGEDGPSGTSLARLFDVGSRQYADTSHPMITGRREHTATVLTTGPNAGKILIVGGRNGVLLTLDSVELYDPADGTFTSHGALGTARTQQQATMLTCPPAESGCVYNGKVLVTGGYSSTGMPLQNAELYDPETGTFATIAMQAAHGPHVAVRLLDGSVLVAGGVWAPTGTAERYVPSSGTFVLAGAMVTPRFDHAGVLLLCPIGNPGCTYGGKVLIAGGDLTAGTGAAVAAELYDPTLDSFSAIASLNTPRHSPAVAMLTDRRVALIGGYMTNFPSAMGLAEREIYDPAAGTFTADGDLTVSRYWATATLLGDGRIFVHGGLGPSSTANSGEFYLPGASASTGPVFTTVSLPDGQAGSYNATIGVTGGSAPYGFDVVSSSLPPGLSLNCSTGCGSQIWVNGTVSAVGTFYVGLKVTDSLGRSATRTFTLRIDALRITTPSLVNATAGWSYYDMLGVLGGEFPVVFSIWSGSLPQDLTMDPYGNITGTVRANAAGNYWITVRARSDDGQVAFKNLTLWVVPAMQVTTTSLPNATAGQSYTQVLAATGGASITWSLLTGSLPPGLSLTSGGTITGTVSPAASGAYPFTVRAHSSSGADADGTLSINVTVPPDLIVQDVRIWPGFWQQGAVSRHMAVFPDGTLLAASANNGIASMFAPDGTPSVLGTGLGVQPPNAVIWAMNSTTGYVIGEDGLGQWVMYAQSGVKAWDSVSYGCCNTWSIPHHAIHLGDGRLWATVGLGRLFSIALNTGTASAPLENKGFAGGMVTIDGQYAYLAGYNGYVSKWNITNAIPTFLWEREVTTQTSAWNLSEGAVDSDGGFVATKAGNHSTSFNLWQAGDLVRAAPDGLSSWSVAARAVTPPVIGQFGRIFVGAIPVDGSPMSMLDAPGVVRAYSGTGVLLWSAPTLGLPQDLFVGDDNNVYVLCGGTVEGRIIVLDQATGALKLSFEHVPAPWEMLLRNGVIYVNGVTSVIAVRLQGLLSGFAFNYDTLAPWPVRQHDNQRTSAK